MRSKAAVALGIVLMLVGACAFGISRYSGHFTLEEPGLMLTDRPLYDEHGELAATNSVYLPVTLPGFTSNVSPVTTEELEWLPKDTTFGRRVYTGLDGFQTSISVVLMGTDRTSIHKPEYCLYGQGFVIDSKEEITIPISRPHAYDLPVMKLAISRTLKGEDGTETKIHGFYLYWFVSKDRITASHNERMWWMAEGLMRSGTLQRWGYITYLGLCHPGEEDALLERLKFFVADSVPEFQPVTLPPEN